MKTISVLVMALLVLSVVPAVLATHVGSGVGIDIVTEDFAPKVWMCARGVADDNVEPSIYGLDRFNNYAFEGESITWLVLVMDKNGVEKISDVYATIGDTQGEGNDIEVNCDRYTGYIPTQANPYNYCDAMIGEEEITSFDPDTMEVYACTLTVETADSMYGEYWATVEAEDMDGLLGTMDENEYWFLNPVIALSVDDDLVFDEDVRPGTEVYSDTLLIGNDADDGSGVVLDMFIAGTDFYDSSSSGAMCPTTNQLSLGAFEYYALNGGQTSGYQGITYGEKIDDSQRIMDAKLYNTLVPGDEDPENFLAPGAEMALTFKLTLPEPCNGDFDTGSIYFWGEAI